MLTAARNPKLNCCYLRENE